MLSVSSSSIRPGLCHCSLGYGEREDVTRERSGLLLLHARKKTFFLWFRRWRSFPRDPNLIRSWCTELAITSPWRRETVWLYSSARVFSQMIILMILWLVSVSYFNWILIICKMGSFSLRVASSHVLRLCLHLSFFYAIVKCSLLADDFCVANFSSLDHSAQRSGGWQTNVSRPLWAKCSYQ